MKNNFMIITLFLIISNLNAQDLNIKLGKDNLDALINNYWNTAKAGMASDIRAQLSHIPWATRNYRVDPRDTPVFTFSNGTNPNEIIVTVPPRILFTVKFEAYVPFGIWIWADLFFDAWYQSTLVMQVETTTKKISVKSQSAEIWVDGANWEADAINGVENTINANLSGKAPTINFSFPFLDLVKYNYQLNSFSYNSATNNIEVGFSNNTPSVTISSNSAYKGTTIPSPGTYYASSNFRVQAYGLLPIYNLNNWNLDGVNVGNGNPYIVQMSGNKSLQAVFAKVLIFDKRQVPIVEIPTEFDVFQNYPNPFNPSTTIKYAVPEPSSVHIGVYDIMGRQILQDDLGNISAGYHEYIVDASRGRVQLSSGVYLYKINIDSETGKHFSFTKKMQLVK